MGKVIKPTQKAARSSIPMLSPDHPIFKAGFIIGQRRSLKKKKPEQKPDEEAK
jgi:hypothetical protein